MAFTDFLELQSKDAASPFQQGKLLVGTGADVRGERSIVLPEFGNGAVFRQVVFKAGERDRFSRRSKRVKSLYRNDLRRSD
jgi:hypothetical protein